MKTKLALSLCLILAACSNSSDQPQTAAPGPAPAPSVQTDGSVVRGTAIVEVHASDSQTLSAQAATPGGSTTVVYVNAPAVTFEIDPSALVAGAMTGDTLSLGRVSVKDLKDNNLNLCGTGGNQRCNTAEIRVYTTGSVAGFVNTSETPNYGVPVYASGLNPTTAVPLNSPGVAVQQVASIPAATHKLKLSDFPNATYNVTADFATGGSGSYKMTFVVEYALKP